MSDGLNPMAVPLRRTPVAFRWWLALIVVASVFIPSPAVQQYMSMFSLVMLMIMIAEGVYLGLTVTRKARAKFPAEDIRGLATGWYSFTRASQPRRLRMPKPRVQRGANP